MADSPVLSALLEAVAHPAAEHLGSIPRVGIVCCLSLEEEAFPNLVLSFLYGMLPLLLHSVPYTWASMCALFGTAAVSWGVLQFVVRRSRCWLRRLVYFSFLILDLAQTEALSEGAQAHRVLSSSMSSILIVALLVRRDKNVSEALKCILKDLAPGIARASGSWSACIVPAYITVLAIWAVADLILPRCPPMHTNQREEKADTIKEAGVSSSQDSSKEKQKASSRKKQQDSEKGSEKQQVTDAEVGKPRQRPLRAAAQKARGKKNV